MYARGHEVRGGTSRGHDERGPTRSFISEGSRFDLFAGQVCFFCSYIIFWRKIPSMVPFFICYEVWADDIEKGCVFYGKFFYVKYFFCFSKVNRFNVCKLRKELNFMNVNWTSNEIKLIIASIIFIWKWIKISKLKKLSR